MVVCGEMLTKMVEPLVSLPSTDSLFPPGGNPGADGDGSASATSLSPLPPDLFVFLFISTFCRIIASRIDPARKSPSPGNSSSVRKIPINYFGKLEIPTPWTRHLQDNKSHWRERAARGFFPICPFIVFHLQYYPFVPLAFSLQRKRNATLPRSWKMERHREGMAKRRVKCRPELNNNIHWKLSGCSFFSVIFSPTFG